MRPTLRCLIVFVAGVPLALAAVTIETWLWPVWFAYAWLVIALVGIDIALGLPRRRLRIVANVPDQLYIGELGHASIELAATRRATVQLLAELDDDLAAQPPQDVVVGPGAPASGRATIDLVPRRRGDHALRTVHVRWPGPLGLVQGGGTATLRWTGGMETMLSITSGTSYVELDGLRIDASGAGSALAPRSRAPASAMAVATSTATRATIGASASGLDAIRGRSSSTQPSGLTRRNHRAPALESAAIRSRNDAPSTPAPIPFACRRVAASCPASRPTAMNVAAPATRHVARNSDPLVEDGILPPRRDVSPARDVAAAALIVIGVALSVFVLWPRGRRL